MVNYIFFATNEKFPPFEETIEAEQIKSINDLIESGITEAEIRKIRNLNLAEVDWNAKRFLFLDYEFPNDVGSSSLHIKEDHQNAYARFLTDKKFIYRIKGIDDAVSHFHKYLSYYKWKEIELWQVVEDDYLIDLNSIKQFVVKFSNLTVKMLEDFFESTTPRKLTIVYE